MTSSKLVYRVFEDATGFFFCDNASEMLDARGNCYPTKEEATARAIEIGRQKEKYENVEFGGVTGSGVCQETAERLGCEVIGD